MPSTGLGTRNLKVPLTQFWSGAGGVVRDKAREWWRPELVEGFVFHVFHTESKRTTERI